MKYGIVIDAGDARTIAGLAEEAEAVGWDGVFISDAIDTEFKPGQAFPWFDPWVALAAIAMKTERIRMGTLIAAVPRRRPWKLARETVSIDQLSGGRLILGVGVGAAEDDGGFRKVGEAMDLKVRAKLMDECLEIVSGLWSGKPFSFSGEHYRVEGMTMLPGPVQTPRIPVWVPGVWLKEKSMRRTLCWDGIIPQKYRSMERTTPDEIRAIKAYVTERRQEATPFDIIVGDATPGNNLKKAVEKVRPYEEAGATWWIEHVWGDAKKLSKRIIQGPPRYK
jgi:hypothetical protein